jgi:hypothetical protein
MDRNPIAEHAARLERESGKSLAAYPYTHEDYARRAALPRGLDQLRAVQDEPMRRTLWALYWLVEAAEGKHPAARQSADLDEWDGAWDPEQRRREEDHVSRRMHLTREGLDGLLEREWSGFEVKMGIASSNRFGQTGSLMSDARKAQHRRKFHEILRKKYGRSEAPQRSEFP